MDSGGWGKLKCSSRFQGPAVKGKAQDAWSIYLLCRVLCPFHCALVASVSAKEPGEQLLQDFTIRGRALAMIVSLPTSDADLDRRSEDGCSEIRGIASLRIRTVVGR